MGDILTIASDGFRLFDALIESCPFGQAHQAHSADSAYAGHGEMKDREFTWVNLGLSLNSSVPSFGDMVYYGGGVDKGKAVSFSDADGMTDANNEPAGFVIGLGKVLEVESILDAQGNEVNDSNGNPMKRAYVQMCYDKKFQN